MIDRIPESGKQRAVELLRRTPLDGPIRSAYEKVRVASGKPGTSSVPTVIDVRDLSTSSVALSAADDLILAEGWVITGEQDLPEGVFELRSPDQSVTTFPIMNWHVERGAVDVSSPHFFHVTVDHAARAGATEGRVVFPDHFTSAWEALPVTNMVGMAASEILTSCDACGADTFTSVGRRHSLEMQRCDRCGLVFTSPRPSQADSLIRYSESYFTNEYLESQTESPAQLRHWSNLLDRVDSYRFPRASLFEIGFGAGGFLQVAKKRGWVVSGSDVNEAAVDYAAARGLNVRLENIDDVSDLGGTFDCIISEMSLEHVRQPRHAVQVSAHALNPGGALLLYTVCAEGQSFRQRGMASYLVGPAEHLFLFSAESLTRLVSDAGLEIQSVWVDNHGDDVGVVAIKPLRS